MNNSNDLKAFLVGFGEIFFNHGSNIPWPERMQVEGIGDLDLDRLGKWVFVRVCHRLGLAFCLILSDVLGRRNLEAILVLKYDKLFLVHLTRRVSNSNCKGFAIALALDF